MQKKMTALFKLNKPNTRLIMNDHLIIQFILIVRLNRKMPNQVFTNFLHRSQNTFRILLLFKMRNHAGTFCLPKIIAHILMNTNVSDNRTLTIIIGNINQHAITSRRLMHFKL